MMERHDTTNHTWGDIRLVCAYSIEAPEPLDYYFEFDTQPAPLADDGQEPESED